MLLAAILALSCALTLAGAQSQPPDAATTSASVFNSTTPALSSAASSPVPPFDYTGYYFDRNIVYSSALRGMCRWTQSDSLCIGTIIPIMTVSVLVFIRLLYDCAMTPQRDALMVNAAALRDSPLWPVSLEAMTQDEVEELAVVSSNLALKDLFPLLGLETLVHRAAALGLATLRDLLCANALAIRDIGVEVREQRIIARSLERLAVQARRVAADKARAKSQQAAAVAAAAADASLSQVPRRLSSARVRGSSVLQSFASRVPAFSRASARDESSLQSAAGALVAALMDDGEHSRLRGGGGGDDDDDCVADRANRDRDEAQSSYAPPPLPPSPSPAPAIGARRPSAAQASSWTRVRSHVAAAAAVQSMMDAASAARRLEAAEAEAQSAATNFILPDL